tara:strand:- start:1821 stop:2180 length:360 start_codon:yes stop_codon:yes gene_type:complete
MSIPDSEFHSLANASDLEEGKGRPVELNHHRIALIRHDGKVYAIEDRCPHADASLAFGPVENGCIACPWHFAEFRLETGEVLSGPATCGIRTYAVRESKGQIEINLDHNADGSLHKTEG